VVLYANFSTSSSNPVYFTCEKKYISSLGFSRLKWSPTWIMNCAMQMTETKIISCGRDICFHVESLDLVCASSFPFLMSWSPHPSYVLKGSKPSLSILSPADVPLSNRGAPPSAFRYLSQDLYPNQSQMSLLSLSASSGDMVASHRQRVLPAR
jgi:hypothetical protein